MEVRRPTRMTAAAWMAWALALMALLAACGSGESKSKSNNSSSPPPPPPSTSDFTDNFSGPFLNSAHWVTPGFERELDGGKLRYTYAGAGKSLRDGITFSGPSLNSIIAMSAKVKVDTFSEYGAGGGRARLSGRWYHSTTAGEQPGELTGDVNAEIALHGAKIVYAVAKCLNKICNRDEDGDFQLLTGGDNGLVQIGTLPIGTEATLEIRWTGSVFEFRIDSVLTDSFDPVAAGAPISNASPTVSGKDIGIRAGMDDGALVELAATFDDVQVDIGSGLALHDDFNSGTYINRTKWNASDAIADTYGGQALLYVVQEQASGWTNGTFSTTTLETQNHLTFSTPRTSAAVTLQTLAVTGVGGTTTPGGRAILELHFDDPTTTGSAVDSVLARIEITRVGLGTPTARLVLQHCSDSTCATFDQVNANFSTVIAMDTPYTVTVEHVSGTTFRGTLGSEQITADFSSFPSVVVTPSYFRSVRLRARVFTSDDVGDSAFAVALFDNVTVGNP